MKKTDRRSIAQNKDGRIGAITHGDVALREPPNPSPGQVERYGLFAPFQIGPRTAAAFCNRRTIGHGHWDYEDGGDLLTFDNLDVLGKMPATRMIANEQEPDRATGGTRVIVKYPVRCGFVPLGALGQSGAIHPHAGTGFGTCVTLSYLVDDSGYYDWHQPFIQRIECHQLSYDGMVLRVDHTDIYGAETVPLRIGETEWIIHNDGLSEPLPDGDDLLAPLTVQDIGFGAQNPGGIMPGSEGKFCGVCRWRHEAGQWRPVAFSPVASGSMEPSLVRDLDGSFLFAVRGVGNKLGEIKVWRSADTDWNWTKIIDIPNGTGPGPVTINRAVDGTPYIASNLYDSFRAKLCMWPLNHDRTGLLPPIMIRDCVADFGAAPGDTTWFADHPISSILRLADGMLHNVMAYRVIAFSTAGRGGETITPATGTYVEEVRSAGHPSPIWRWSA